MSRRARTWTLPLLGCCALLALGGCGDSHTRVSTGTYAGESGAGAPYLNVGPLIYEVQLSRELNPFDTEDASYLQGLPPRERTLTSSQEWLAVFIQVFNENSVGEPAASNPTITDTQGITYAPIDPEASNQFAFRGGAVPPKGRLPLPDSIAGAGPTQGALLLYKIRIESLNNRPLKITFVDPNDASQRATAELDV
jgi:hypothetical protein